MVWEKNAYLPAYLRDILIPAMDKSTMKESAIRRLKTCAIVCLSFLALFIINELLRMYQTSWQLSSPLIPKMIVQHINQEYLQHAVVSSIMLLIAIGMYLLKRYWYAILLVAITLVGNQYLS